MHHQLRQNPTSFVDIESKEIAVPENSDNTASTNNIRCSKKKSIIFPIDGFSNLYLALHKCDRVTLDGVRKIRFRTKKPSQTVL